MTRYDIRCYGSGPAGHLYAIYEAGNDVSELDRTLLALHGSTCDSGQRAVCHQYNLCGREDCRRAELVTQILTVLKRGTHDTGFDTSFFQPIRGYTLPTRALGRGPIRVYGLRYDKSLFVAGPAALKLVKAIRDDKEVARLYHIAERARVALKKRLKLLPDVRYDADDNPIPPRDELGRCFLPDAVLQPF